MPNVLAWLRRLSQSLWKQRRSRDARADYPSIGDLLYLLQQIDALQAMAAGIDERNAPASEADG